MEKNISWFYALENSAPFSRKASIGVCREAAESSSQSHILFYFLGVHFNIILFRKTQTSQCSFPMEFLHHGLSLSLYANVLLPFHAVA